MTAAEKAADSEAKKAEKEAEKAAKKAEKEAEKAAAKEAKEAEKAEKEVKKPVVKASVPTAAIKKPVEPVEPVAEKAAAVPAPKKKPAPKVEERSVPNDGMVHPCTIKGKKYLRNAEGETWLVGADDGIGAWAGIYDAKTDKLDTSAPEPVFDA
jgi:outer membrane biosynthesis protein TonB